VNLSSCLAAAGKDVILIDSDPQANASTGMGIDAKDNESTTYELLISDKKLKDCLLDTQLEKLKLVPSNINLVGAELELVEFESRERQLKDKITEFLYSTEKGFKLPDYIFIDCPPSLSLITVNALSAADTVLIPVQCEYYALEGLTQLLNTIKMVKKTFNPSLSIEGYLLTMFDSRLRLANQVENELRNVFGEMVFQTKISRNVKIGEAPSYGKPIVVYDSLSTGAKNYTDLSTEFLQRNNITQDYNG
jgi:chromosome partitioning protein